MTRVLRALRIVAALFGCALLATQAIASVNNGRISGVAPWVTSPGGAPCNFSFAVDWFADDNANVITLQHTIRVNAAAGSAAITNAELTNWKNRIEGRWNTNSVYIVATDPDGVVTNWTVRYNVTFSTTVASSDYTVTIHDGSGGSNTSDWYRSTGGGYAGVNDNTSQVPAHETGHFLANSDEYTDGGCIVPGNPFNALSNTTVSLMNGVGNTQSLFSRHYHLWWSSMVAFDNAKHFGNTYSLAPEPAAFSIAFYAVVFATRRRRAA